MVYGEELLLDVWDFMAQEALWGLHASLHPLFVCVFLKGEAARQFANFHYFT